MNIAQKWRRVVRAIVGMPDDEGQPPLYDRMAFYRAKVAACANDGSTCDLQPEDSRFPSMKNVPVRVGVPGLQAVVQPGAVVLLGWERGDPARPYCEPSWESGAGVTQLIFKAALVYLGDSTGANFVALANKVDAEFAKISTTLSSLTGATFGTAYTQAPTGASKTKAV